MQPLYGRPVPIQLTHVAFTVRHAAERRPGGRMALDLAPAGMGRLTGDGQGLDRWRRLAS
jgi:hypothetical protein